ncbi:unnamed protein product [Triticum turgidum subsp. durum]|uniref:SAC3/GANP/THP3 conserved domain-containing protein n=1 Tax=Triticum turgidum subsp. durum TaxID=4567 RepID=A0A9R0SDF9_TRITD|nr:unnamed protein product [Triticum turgidum subsp. durum]
MDRRDGAGNRGRSYARGNARGRGWPGRCEDRGRPSTQPPPSTAPAAAVIPSDAQPIVGTCPDMCPATERAQRERLRDLAVFERVSSDPMRTSHSLAVKKVSRP